ncbi:hypothetical protein [Thermoactinomyces sp. DSM 45892]|uniref:hypothetical protein n=1 Tax=Thermoactinomyces sp. DSM 45892 TaxID=1882753 RepID=UPI00089BA2B7|nr:hypothetical protein [Thermoactinomyces sp. DSM 45892]SDZ05446.1 hypothetical protein SAMN05444416_11295 [Thermoactinomyces sp. DSM 45892]
MQIKTTRLNEYIIRQLGLEVFDSVKAKDLYINTVVKYTDLLPCEIDVLYTISRYSTKVPGVCWATVTTMLKDKHVKVKERAFRKGIRGLKEKGIIIVHETRRMLTGGKGTNIYQFSLEYISSLEPKEGPMQVEGTGRVQVEDAGRKIDETPCPTTDELTNFETKESFNECVTNLYNLKDKAISNMPEHKMSDDNIYETEKEKYCLASGVPCEVVKELKPYFSTNEIIGYWKSIKGALRNVGEYYELHVQEVLNAIRKSVAKFKRKEIRTTFGANLVGTLKGMISDKYQALEDSFIEREMEERRAFYGISSDVNPISQGRFS